MSKIFQNRLQKIFWYPEIFKTCPLHRRRVNLGTSSDERMLRCFRNTPGSKATVYLPRRWRPVCSKRLPPHSQFHQKLNISLIQLKIPKQPREQETTHRVHLLGAPPFGWALRWFRTVRFFSTVLLTHSQLSFWKSRLRWSRAALTSEKRTKASAGASKDLSNTAVHSPSRRRGHESSPKLGTRGDSEATPRTPTRGFTGSPGLPPRAGRQPHPPRQPRGDPLPSALPVPRQAHRVRRPGGQRQGEQRQQRPAPTRHGRARLGSERRFPERRPHDRAPPAGGGSGGAARPGTARAVVVQRCSSSPLARPQKATSAQEAEIKSPLFGNAKRKPVAPVFTLAVLRFLITLSCGDSTQAVWWCPYNLGQSYKVLV